MKLTHQMVLLSHLAIFISLVSCSSAKLEQTSILQDTHNVGQSAELLTCDVSGGWKTNCRITNPSGVVIPASGIHAEVSVKYSFSCNRIPVSTFIRLTPSGEQGYNLQVSSNAVDLGKFNTEKAIQLIDDQPGKTANWMFQAFQECGMQLSWTMAPSNQQIILWASETRRIVETLSLNLEIYELKGKWDEWFRDYIDDQSNAGALRTRYDYLSALPNPTLGEREEKMTISEIFMGVPWDVINKKLDPYRANIIRMRGEAISHRTVLQKWKQVVDAKLKALEDRSAGV